MTIRGRMFYGNWITLLMLYVLVFTGGMGFYIYPIFVPRLEEEFGWTRFQTVGATAPWAIVYGLSGFFVGAWIRRFGARRVFLAGIIGGATMFVVTSMINQLWQLVVVLMVSGITVAASTLVPAQTVITLWFTRMRGRSMGLALMGNGLGGWLLPPLVAVLIPQTGWRDAYRLCALILVVLTVPPVLLFLRNQPADIGEVPDGGANATSDSDSGHVPTGISARRAVRSPAFWLLFSTYLLQLYVMSAININTTAFAEGAGYTQLVAPLFMALALGISVPGRFLYGWISDRIRPELLMASVGLLFAVSTVVLDIFVIRLGWINYVPIGLFAVTQGMGIAGSTVVLPILVGRCFGDLEFGKIQGLVMAGFAVGAIFGGPSAAKVYDITGSYELAFVVCAIFGVVSMALALQVRPYKLEAEFQAAPTTNS